MKTRILSRIATVFMFTVIIVLVGSIAKAERPGSSPFSPAPLGSPVQTIIGCGMGYDSHELYDAKITLLEIVRGEEAWSLIRKAKTDNEPPRAGFDYVLARVKFEYSARGMPGNCAHVLRKGQFTALSHDGEVYESDDHIVPPSPRLNGTIRSGDFIEGWIVFLVAKGDHKPLMNFSAQDGGAVEHGGNIWFQLYK